MSKFDISLVSFEGAEISDNVFRGTADFVGKIGISRKCLNDHGGVFGVITLMHLISGIGLLLKVDGVKDLSRKQRFELIETINSLSLSDIRKMIEDCTNTESEELPF